MRRMGHLRDRVNNVFSVRSFYGTSLRRPVARALLGPAGGAAYSLSAMHPIADSLQRGDLRLLRVMRTRGHTHALERAVARASRTGEHAACWFALGGLGAATADERAARAAWLRGMEIIVTAYGLNSMVKLLVRRPRPALDGLPALSPVVSTLSFPSAHATTSFAAVVAYRRLVPGAALLTLATGLALSRPYLGVHYPSDVLAGALLGTLLAAAWPAEGMLAR